MSQALQELLDQERIENATEDDVEFSIYELIDSRDSGWIKEGTENLPEPQQLKFPGARKILNVSAYAKWKNPKDKTKGYDRVEIRHIFGAQNIEVSKQDVSLANPDLDSIVFKNGRFIVTNEGSTACLFKFMKHDSRNVTSEFRIPGAEGVYREIFPEKEKENSFEEDFDATDAVNLVKELVRKENGKYNYDESRLTAFCRLFGVSADTNGGRVTSLIGLAKYKPQDFIEKIRMYEQTIFIEIAHALELNVIELDANAAVYPDKEKIITSYSGKLSKEEKINEVAKFFMSEDGKEEYKIFQAELEFKKKNALNN